MPRIPPEVVRIDAPGLNFGIDDRSVAVILPPDPPTIEHALVVEEYIVEQLDHEVVGELVVVRDPRMRPDAGRSYALDPSLDVPFAGREPDGIVAVDWSAFLDRQTRAARERR